MVLIVLATVLAGPVSTSAQTAAPTVTGVEVTSDAGDDNTYAMGDTILIAVNFSEAVLVTGTPQLAIDMDPAHWGTKWANYVRGTGSASLTFSHRVIEPNYSTRGIAVLANTLRLNGGTISAAASPTDADLAHAGLGHDAKHKVDWHLAPTTPTVSAVAVTSHPGGDKTYAKDDVIRITLSFSEAVDVTGTPQLAIDMDPAFWGTKWANYLSGTGSTSLTFTHTVVQPNFSSQGIAVLADTLKLNGGTINSTSSQTSADLSHSGLSHDANHQVNWEHVLPTNPDCALTAPSSVEALTIGQGAVVSWTVPSDQDDACVVTGFVVSATGTGELRLSLEDVVTDPAARTHTLRGLTPGDYVFSVRIQYAEGDSEDLETAYANTVADACITLAVRPWDHRAIAGKITSVSGTGCLAREEFEFEIKRKDDDYWSSYGRFPWTLLRPGSGTGPPGRPAWALPTDPNQANDFIFYGMKPYVGYDFRISAYDASGDKYTTSDQRTTILKNDPSDAAAEANSPGDVRLYDHNNSNAYLSWGEPTVESGRTLSAYVIQWKTETGAVMSSELASNATPTSDFQQRRFHISGLTDGLLYTARVAARTHPDGNSSNTRDRWSVWAPAIRAWSEPTQFWFSETTPNNNPTIGRVFMWVEANKANASVNCFLRGPSFTDAEINCPPRTLVSLDGIGAITASGTGSWSGQVSPSEGTVGGPTGFKVYGSGGAGQIAVAWEAAGEPGVGNLDAYIVQRRSGTSGAWTDTVFTNTDTAFTSRTATIRGPSNAALADGTWQVRVRGRSDGDDSDPMTTDSPILGFTSEILTVTVDADSTVVPWGVEYSVTPGDSKSLTLEWELPDSGSRPFAYQVRHRVSGTANWTTSDTQFVRHMQRNCGLSSGFACLNPRSYTINGLTGGALQEVELRIQNANGWSVWFPTTGRPNN
ncbi:MAG: fibronectin type III domain-containing protein [Acidimicrobiaceae bacterium]|nr:fibronectin type III domain-containing protein [Acidimicrobiaceae bacterium]